MPTPQRSYLNSDPTRFCFYPAILALFAAMFAPLNSLGTSLAHSRQPFGTHFMPSARSLGQCDFGEWAEFSLLGISPRKNPTEGRRLRGAARCWRLFFVGPTVRPGPASHKCRTLGRMTSTLAHRLEARVDYDTNTLISKAASALGESKSAFIVRAARDAAIQVVGRRDVTPMDADLFDALIDSLDTPDPAPRLAKAAAAPRRFRQS